MPWMKSHKLFYPIGQIKPQHLSSAASRRTPRSHISQSQPVSLSSLPSLSLFQPSSSSFTLAFLTIFFFLYLQPEACPGSWNGLPSYLHKADNSCHLGLVSNVTSLAKHLHQRNYSNGHPLARDHLVTLFTFHTGSLESDPAMECRGE